MFRSILTLLAICFCCTSAMAEVLVPVNIEDVSFTRDGIFVEHENEIVELEGIFYEKTGEYIGQVKSSK